MKRGIQRRILDLMAASLAVSVVVPLGGFAATPVKHATQPVKKTTTTSAPVPKATVYKSNSAKPDTSGSSSLANPPSLPLINVDAMSTEKPASLQNSTTTEKSTEKPASTLKSAPPTTTSTTITGKTTKTMMEPAKAADNAAELQTAHVDFLRSIPLEVDGYDAGKSMPAHFTTASEVMSVINGTPVLLVHMEALRRGYHDLSPAEQDKLLSELLKRHKVTENDLGLGFDYGYAQLVYKQNKTGLFFLRKANDKFQTQFSNLAYGMAQVEADINLEGAKPDETTTRKMDATYDLGDAVKIDAINHQPGFWPSFIRVIDKMRALPAYQSFTRRDFSAAYVPSGSHVVSLGGANTSSIALTEKPASLLNNALNTSCNPNAGTEADDAAAKPGNPMAQRSANFNGSTALIQFFPTEQAHQYRVRVFDPAGNPMLSFKSYAMPNIVEDIDGDGVQEIVVRQYAYNPEQPVLVYRYTPCGFELDKKIFDDFR